MNFRFNDGGREQSGYKGSTGDCVTRAIAIATCKTYGEVYDRMFLEIRKLAATRSSAATRRAARGGGGRVQRHAMEYLKKCIILICLRKSG